MPFVKRQRTYYKYIYRDWTPPVLTGFGTMGGDSFAVSASSNYGGHDFWKLFAASPGQWHSGAGLPQQVSWYNPIPLQVTGLYFPGHGAGNIGDFIIQASDDNNGWEDIISYSNANSTGDFEVDLSSNTKAFKYWRIYITSCYYFTGGNRYPLIAPGFKITAKEKLVIELNAISGVKEDADYYIDNNKLYQLAAVKRSYYKYGTEPNATIVGNFARIDKGVASGFSASNYLTLPEVFNPQNNTWEQVWSVTTGENTSAAYQEILAQSNVGTAAVSGYDLRVDAGKIKLYVEGTVFTGATVLQDYTKYLIKAQYTGSAYILSYSTDNGDSWVEDCNVASAVTGVPDMNVPQYVGVWKSTYNSTPDKAWQGTIDLSKSYIKINNEVWWSGDSYTKVGSWIEDGVVSGFSTSNYLSLQETFTIRDSDSFEIVVSFVHKTQSSIGYVLGASTDATLGIIVNSNNTLKVNAGNGSSWYGDIFGSTVLTSGVKYWVKLVRDTSGWYLYLSTDGKEYNLEKSNTWSGAPRSTNIYVGNVQGNTPFLGKSIDLNESYININGERWWHGTKAYQINVGGEDVYKDWTQPVLTSDTDQNCIVTCSAAHNGYPAYYAIDNSKTNCWFSNTKTGWWQIKFPKKILITGLTHIAGAYSQQTQGIAGRYYTSSSKTTPIGDGISGTYAQGDAVNISNIPAEGILTDTIYFEKTGGSGTPENSGIGQLLITAKELKAVGGTVEDSDYHVDRNVSYNIMLKH